MRCKEPEISNSMSSVTGSLWNLLQLHCRAWHDAAVVEARALAAIGVDDSRRVKEVRIACRVFPAGL